MQATRELRSTGIMQHKRVSNRVGRPCSIRNRVLRVVCAGSTSAPPRAAMKSADRNLKRATRAFGFVWSCYRYIWARSKSASRARPGGHINGTQRRDFANELLTFLRGTGRHRVQIAHFFRMQIGSWGSLGVVLVVGSRLYRIRRRCGSLFFFRVLDLTAENNPPTSGRKKPCP